MVFSNLIYLDIALQHIFDVDLDLVEKMTGLSSY